MWREVTDAVPDTLDDATDETRRCLDYGVTEMLNNAIDHSEGSVVTLAIRADDDNVEIVIGDDGIGALQNVRTHFDLANDLEAIVHIAKGRQTTAPAFHSGQGLFFTSKVVDYFNLDSGQQAWKVDNVRDDETVAPGSGQRGTRVTLEAAVTRAVALPAIRQTPPRNGRTTSPQSTCPWSARCGSG